MSAIDMFCRALLGGLDLLGDWGMLQAAVARLADKSGISIAVPEQPGEEVTPEIRAYILAVRARYTEEEWLLPKGPRDQVCVRFGVSRGQIAGVLAGDARRANGASNGNGATRQTDHGAGASDVPTITADPATWPRRSGGVSPSPGKPVHALDETDRTIARVVFTSDRWSELRPLIQEYRSLTRQQVAGMRARLTRVTATGTGYSPNNRRAR